MQRVRARVSVVACARGECLGSHFRGGVTRYDDSVLRRMKRCLTAPPCFAARLMRGATVVNAGAIVGAHLGRRAHGAPGAVRAMRRVCRDRAGVWAVSSRAWGLRSAPPAWLTTNAGSCCLPRSGLTVRPERTHAAVLRGVGLPCRLGACSPQSTTSMHQCTTRAQHLANARALYCCQQPPRRAVSLQALLSTLVLDGAAA